MKKIGVFILAMAIVLVSGCAGEKKSANHSQQWEPSEQILRVYYGVGLSIHQTETAYVVHVGPYGQEKTLSFSLDKKKFDSPDLELVSITDPEQYIGKTPEELQQLLGKEHTDNGSGFYIPSYITPDFCLIGFVIYQGKVTSVHTQDLAELLEEYGHTPGKNDASNDQTDSNLVGKDLVCTPYEALTIYRTQTEYVAVVYTDDQSEKKTVRFNKDTGILISSDLTLVSREKLAVLQGMHKDEIYKDLGPAHFTTVSGEVHTPCYITEDFQSVALFCDDNGIVFNAWTKNLATELENSGTVLKTED